MPTISPFAGPDSCALPLRAHISSAATVGTPSRFIWMENSSPATTPCTKPLTAMQPLSSKRASSIRFASIITSTWAMRGCACIAVSGFVQGVVAGDEFSIQINLEGVPTVAAELIWARSGSAQESGPANAEIVGIQIGARRFVPPVEIDLRIGAREQRLENGRRLGPRLLLVGPCLRAAAVAFAIETAGRVIFGLEPIGASSAVARSEEHTSE